MWYWCTGYPFTVILVTYSTRSVSASVVDSGVFPMWYWCAGYPFTVILVTYSPRSFSASVVDSGVFPMWYWCTGYPFTVILVTYSTRSFSASVVDSGVFPMWYWCAGYPFTVILVTYSPRSFSASVVDSGVFPMWYWCAGYPFTVILVTYSPRSFSASVVDSGAFPMWYWCTGYPFTVILVTYSTRSFSASVVDSGVFPMWYWCTGYPFTVILVTYSPRSFSASVVDSGAFPMWYWCAGYPFTVILVTYSTRSFSASVVDSGAFPMWYWCAGYPFTVILVTYSTRSFSASVVDSGAFPMWYWCAGFPLPRCRTLHFSSLHCSRHFLLPSCSLVRCSGRKSAAKGSVQEEGEGLLAGYEPMNDLEESDTLGKTLEGHAANLVLADILHKIDHQQFGNLKGRSTTLYMVYLLDAILKGLEQRDTVAHLCLIDFKKAFDNVDHSGRGVPNVLIDTKEYLSKIDNILSDTTKFKKITRNPTEALKKRLNKLIAKNNSTCDVKFDRLTGEYEMGNCYGNVKTHKPGNKLRPIISQIPTPTYNIAKRLCALLTPYIPTTYCLQSATDFIDILKNNNAGGRVASLDAESLFTNVPVDRTINYIIDLVYKNNSTPTLAIPEAFDEYPRAARSNTCQPIRDQDAQWDDQHSGINPPPLPTQAILSGILTKERPCY
ncbi:uncharacterized protein LOC126994647 [Eriocheir sinensis]|uniref:uncharacterized protein LOC126994647 n=1 Tax=Eriocheir sinensis TaxID=95602 RepID=UPI0021CA58BF|nr:uncharacterized protein LOC126994647 [Eriocheir sinensis]